MSRVCAASLAALLLLCAGCSAIDLRTPEPARDTWLLSGVPPVAAVAGPGAGVLLVDKPESRPGYDTPRMAYSRRALALDYYTKSEWADTPARMLQTLLAQTLAQGGTWSAVLAAPNPGRADVRLTTSVLEFVHDLSAGEPGIVRVRVHVTFSGIVDRRVLAARDFAAEEPAASADAEGYARAADRASAHVLAELAGYAAQTLVPAPAARPARTPAQR